MTSIIARITVWVESVFLIAFSLYSISIISVGVVNLSLLLAGMSQLTMYKKWGRLVLNAVGVELFLLALLSLGIFFVPTEHENFDISIELRIVLFSFTALICLFLSWACLGEASKMK